MKGLAKLWGVSLASYAVAQFAAGRFFPASPVPPGEVAAWMAVVPLLQGLLLLAALWTRGARVRGEGPGGPRLFLVLWVLLGAAAAVGRAGASFVFFRHLDFTYGAFAQAILVPAAQAAAVFLVARPREEGPRPDRPSLTFPWAHPLLALDLALVAAAFFLPGQAGLGFDPVGSGPAPLLSVVIVLKATLATVLLIAGLGNEAREEAARAAGPASAMGTIVLAAGIAAYGADAWTGWLLRAPGALFPRLSEPFSWLATIPALFLVAIGFLVKLSETDRAGQSGARPFLERAVAFALLSATIVVLGLFRRPFLVEPWRFLSRGASYLSFSMLFLGVLAWTRRDSRPGR